MPAPRAGPGRAPGAIPTATSAAASLPPLLAGGLEVEEQPARKTPPVTTWHRPRFVILDSARCWGAEVGLSLTRLRHYFVPENTGSSSGSSSGLRRRSHGRRIRRLPCRVHVPTLDQVGNGQPKE